ncbi:SpoIIE family protein phosphatase [Streptomyces sp. NPDC001595]|uniref:SpoIIE family protein phosphatase n=1 Tax=Streptomyces sp. NPDC001532 TaxID=3154520 RepID=UPI0033308D33
MPAPKKRQDSPDLGGRPGPWEEAVLEAVFTQSDVGLHVLDTELRVIRLNTVASGVRGIPADRILGLPAAEAYRSVGVTLDENVLREVLTTGRPVTDYLLVGRPPADSGNAHVFSASAHRLQDSSGSVLGLVVTTTDVTERERAQARLRLLHEARERIGPSLDVERTVRELVGVTVPRFADSVVVALTDAVLRGRDPALQPADVPPLLRCAATGRTDDGPPVPKAGGILLPGVFGSDAVPQSAVLSASPTGGPADRRVVAPLTVRGQLLGAVAFQRADTADPYVPDDLELADGIVGRTAICLDNALRFTREHIVMTALQDWPPRTEQATQRAVDVARRHRPGGNGAGSWFDLIPLPGARVALVVGQVEHPGLSAVATMSRLRTAVHSLTTLDLDPHELLARLHAITLRLAAEHDTSGTDDRPTAHCTIAVHDPVTGSLDIACAGNRLAVVVRPDGSADPHPVGDGSLLGAEGPPFASASHLLPAGSTLCLASSAAATEDGPATEALLAALARPERDPETMADDVERLLAPDRVLLVARTRRLPPDELAEWDIPFDFASVATARTRVEDRLRQWEQPTDPFTATLVTSELLTNAIRYGAAPLTLRLIRNNPGLTVEVSDAGQAAPHLRHAKAVDEGGRGLLICASVAEDWGVRYTTQGKTVWADI